MSADGGTRNIIVVASLVHSCAITKNAIVASQLHDVADVQFTMLTSEFGEVRVDYGLELLLNLYGNKVKQCETQLFTI